MNKTKTREKKKLDSAALLSLEHNPAIPEEVYRPTRMFSEDEGAKYAAFVDAYQRLDAKTELTAIELQTRVAAEESAFQMYEELEARYIERFKDRPDDVLEGLRATVALTLSLNAAFTFGIYRRWPLDVDPETVTLQTLQDAMQEAGDMLEAGNEAAAASALNKAVAFAALLEEFGNESRMRDIALENTCIFFACLDAAGAEYVERAQELIADMVSVRWEFAPGHSKDTAKTTGIERSAWTAAVDDTVLVNAPEILQELQALQESLEKLQEDKAAAEIAEQSGALEAASKEVHDDTEDVLALKGIARPSTGTFFGMSRAARIIDGLGERSAHKALYRDKKVEFVLTERGRSAEKTGTIQLLETNGITIDKVPSFIALSAYYHVLSWIESQRRQGLRATHMPLKYLLRAIYGTPDSRNNFEKATDKVISALIELKNITLRIDVRPLIKEESKDIASYFSGLDLAELYPGTSAIPGEQAEVAGLLETRIVHVGSERYVRILDLPVLYRNDLLTGQYSYILSRFSDNIPLNRTEETISLILILQVSIERIRRISETGKITSHRLVFDNILEMLGKETVQGNKRSRTAGHIRTILTALQKNGLFNSFKELTGQSGKRISYATNEKGKRGARVYGWDIVLDSDVKEDASASKKGKEDQQNASASKKGRRKSKKRQQDGGA